MSNVEILDSAEPNPGAIPHLVKWLSTGEPEKREEAFGLFCDQFVRVGTWNQFTVSILEQLWEAKPRALQFELHLRLATELLAGSAREKWLSGVETEPDNSYYRAAVALLRKHKSAIFECLDADSPALQASAAGLLAMLPSLSTETVPVLVEHWSKANSGVVRAALLVALERLAGANGWTARAQAIADKGDADPLVRGAASICWLRHDQRNQFSDVARGLAAWFNTVPSARRWLLWENPKSFPLTGWKVLTQLLTQRATLDAIALIGDLIACADVAQDRHLGAAISTSLSETFLASNRGVLLASELSEHQRSIAELMCRTSLCPDTTWVPGSVASRKRWLGKESPGPLERSVMIELDGKLTTLPAWRAWRELETRNAPGYPIPDALWAQYTPIERWQATIEYRTGNYSQREYPLNSTGIARILGELTVDDSFERAGIAIAEAILSRNQYTEYPHYGYRMRWVNELLLHPLVRAGRELSPMLERFVILDGNVAFHKELLRATRPDYLVQRMNEELDSADESKAAGVVSNVLSAIDLAPDQAVCSRLATLAWSIRQVEPFGKECWKRCQEVARAIPTLMTAIQAVQSASRPKGAARKGKEEVGSKTKSSSRSSAKSDPETPIKKTAKRGASPKK